MSPAPVGDHIPMHIWATLTELNGLSRGRKEHEDGGVLWRALKREHRAICDHISLSACMKFSRVTIILKIVIS